MFTHRISDALAEILLIFLLNDENNLAKARSDRIIDREVDNLMTLVIYRIDLL